MGMDPVTGAALITGGSQLASGVLSSQQKGQKVPQTYNPFAIAMQQRALAVVDNYLKKKGIEALIPPELMPYELRPVEQRKAIVFQLLVNSNFSNIYIRITFG